MIGIPIALISANATEWFVHKYVLHGLGRRRDSWWAFHWHGHHRTVRRAGFRDVEYERDVRASSAKRREASSVLLAAAAVTPLLPVAPFFTITSWYCAYNYYRVHKRSHLDPAWAREHLPWHWDHHMGPDQDANWCVTRPWFDHVMGTRQRWAGTEAERIDIERQKRAAEARGTARQAAAAAAAGAAGRDDEPSGQGVPQPSEAPTRAASSRSSTPSTRPARTKRGADASGRRRSEA